MPHQSKIKARLLYNDLNCKRQSWRQQAEDLILLICLLGLFTSPLWLSMCVSNFN